MGPCKKLVCGMLSIFFIYRFYIRDCISSEKFVSWNEVKGMVTKFTWNEMKWNVTHSSTRDVKWKLMKLFFTNDRGMRWNEVKFMKFMKFKCIPWLPATCIHSLRRCWRFAAPAFCLRADEESPCFFLKCASAAEVLHGAALALEARKSFKGVLQ